MLHTLRFIAFLILVPGFVMGYMPYWILSNYHKPVGIGNWKYLGYIFLVDKGIYKFTRNPMYLGVLGVLLGLTLLNDSLAMLYYFITVFSFLILLYCYWKNQGWRSCMDKNLRNTKRKYQDGFGKYSEMIICCM